MDTKTKLQHWMKNMGYDGPFPSNIENICNPSTAFIWEQIIQKVRPRQEVEICHRNIIINRLKTKSLKDQDEFSYPIAEIENYRQKMKLTDDLVILQNKIQEKEGELDQLSKDNNLRYVTIENYKKKIKESEMRAYMLENKSKMLENEITSSEEMLVHARNLTPVELDENPNTVAITETLKKCSEKLEKHINEMPHNTDPTSFITRASLLSSIQKTGRKYMTSHRKLVYTTEKKKNPHSAVARALYTDNKARKPKYDRYLSETKCDSNALSVDNIPSIITEEASKAPQDIENKENKRESLGILPDACLEVTDDHTFLQDVPVFKTPDKSAFDLLDVQNSIQKRQTPTFSIMSDDRKKEVSYERIYKDEFVAENIRSMLHRHNRSVIWNSVGSLCDDLLSETRNVVMQFVTSTNNKRKVNEADIAKLHSVHLETELMTIKSKLVNTDLRQRFEKTKKKVLRALLSHPALRENQADVQRIFHLQIEEAKLDAAISSMKKEINSSRRLEISNELQIIQSKIAKAKNEIYCRLNIIQEYTDEIFKVFRSINRVHDDTACSVRRLNNFISDMHWAMPLTENLNSQEIELFTQFPLEYNRRFSFTDPKTFYRDICTNDFPSYLHMDTNELKMAVTLLESPFSPPEVMIINILRAKLKLSAMKSLQNLPIEMDHKTYSFEDLQKQESYLQYALDKLNLLLHSPMNTKVLSSANKMREVMDLWLEMPFKNFISPKRLVNEKGYTYYENTFDKFFNEL